ncbi:MAG TPA: vanadium-dependent haloperoxidase, partial [Stellaceae bacterium]|nr:vanadium-dependent haloperoxidase [Stellaceae bacterium]
TISDNKGQFEFTNVQLAPGMNKLTAAASDSLGNTRSFTLPLNYVPQTRPQGDVVLQWDQIALNAIVATASDTVTASRALAMESLAVLDTVNAIDNTPSYLVHLGAPADASVSAAVAAAAHEILVSLYPQQKSVLDALFAQSLAVVQNGQGKIDGVALGTTIADDILKIRANDGSNVTVPDAGSLDQGAWRPTGPDFGLAISPQFANVTPFAVGSASQFLSSVAPPPAIGSAAYQAALNEVQSLGDRNSTERTADQTQIAQFWAGGLGSVTIAGQWNQIAAQVAASKDDSLSQNARLFAELNVGEADTGIATWNAKYTYNFWSPVTALQASDPNFTPLVTTPEAPEYVETQA